MSNQWYTIFGPKDWDGVDIITGNKKIDATYYNILGDKNIQLAASGHMWLVGKSGIQLISQGYVDASGLRVHNLRYKSLSKIDSQGNIVPAYVGNVGSLVYKSGDNELAVLPNDLLSYNSILNALTLLNHDYGPLYVSSGNIDNPDSHELKSYPYIEYKEADGEDIPAEVKIAAKTVVGNGLRIYPNLNSYKGSVLTHMGQDKDAEWSAAPYLKAEGVLWHRFSKRPALINDGEIVFYINKPSWAQDWEEFGNDPVETLQKEFGASETVELTDANSREIQYVKFAAQTTYLADQLSDPAVSPLLGAPEFTIKTIIDPDTGETVQGVSVLFCPRLPWDDQISKSVNGYACSVTKGGYLDMQLARDYTKSTQSIICQGEETPFTFKPSTINSISIRPNHSTAFNMLGENIDFAIYGKAHIPYNNYDSDIFSLNDNKLPNGLIPAFKIDANINNSVSGDPSRGVYFNKYLDRNKTIPSGYSFDYKPKVIINDVEPYKISSIVSGTETLTTYADLTVRSSIYSDNIIAKDIYLLPLPSSNGKYIQNALLTINKEGKIISRVPRTNPTLPGAPYGLVGDPGHNMNGIGNTEVSLLWEAPSNNGNSNITNYIIGFSVNNGSTWTVLDNNVIGGPTLHRPSSNATFATVKNLSPSLNYSFRVAAQNAIGIGTYSEPSVNMLPSATARQSPINFVVNNRTFDVDASTSTIDLSWDPGVAGNGTLTGYLLEESSDSGLTWQNFNNIDELLTDTYITIHGVPASQNYYYRLSSWNNLGKQSAYTYIYSSGNYIPDNSLLLEEEMLSTWDFGRILFTGVCPT